MFSRRTLLAAAATSPLISPTKAAPSAAPSATQRTFLAFTKPLQSVAPEQLAQRLSAMGYTGVECPIRSGGRIDPTKIAEELPRHLRALAESNVDITIAATDINDPDDAATETILRALVDAGVGHYRMAYYRYDKTTPLPRQIDAFTGKMKALAAMNRDLGIAGLYQNHANYRMFGGPIWDLHRSVENIDPAQLGVAFDLRHATVEGGKSYPLEWQLIRDHVRAFYVKDFQWVDGDLVNRPLGRGQCDRDFYGELTDEQKAMPMSVHVEYLGHRDPKAVPQIFEAFETDRRTLATWIH